MVTFEAYGEAAPQGSKVAGITRDGRPYVRDSDPKNLREWRRAVADAAARVAASRNLPVIDGPVAIWTVFFLRPPKSRPAWKRMVDTSKDVDKLTRAVLDALKDRLIRDDRQVVYQCSVKVYAVDCPPKAVVRLMDLASVQRDANVVRLLLTRGDGLTLGTAFA